MRRISEEGIKIGDNHYDFDIIHAMDLKGLWVLQRNGGSSHNNTVSLYTL